MSSTTSWRLASRFRKVALLVCLLALATGYLLATPVAARVGPGGDQQQGQSTNGRRALQQIPEPPATTGLGIGGPTAGGLPAPSATLITENATDIAQEAFNTSTTERNVANQTVSTIFAPTDAAFERLAAALNLTSALDLFNGTLNGTASNITALHVIPGEAITTANLTAGVNVTSPTLLAGFNITIMPEANGTVLVTIPGSDVVAAVITPNVPFQGNIVHLIDKVLLPPANATANWAMPLAVNTTGL